MAERKPLVAFKLRTSLWGGWCCVCNKPIEPSDRYFDGGGWRRAHHDCACAAENDPSIEKTRKQQHDAQEKRSKEWAQFVMSKPPVPVRTVDAGELDRMKKGGERG